MLMVYLHRIGILKVMSGETGHEIIKASLYEALDSEHLESDQAYYRQVLEGNLEAHIVNIGRPDDRPLRSVVFVTSSPHKPPFDPEADSEPEEESEEYKDFSKSVEAAAKLACDKSGIRADYFRHEGRLGSDLPERAFQAQ